MAREVALDKIWTYERAEGRRLSFPYDDLDAGGSQVQLDFVFGEPLLDPPAPVTLALGGEPVSLLAASPGESLLWKLLWLATDMYPQGKDLYDAVLLAELPGITLDEPALNVALRRANTLPLEGPGGSVAVLVDHLRSDGRLSSSEWRHFQNDYPEIAGSADEWLERLARAGQR